VTTLNESPAFNVILPAFSERGACADSDLPADTWHAEGMDRAARAATRAARQVCRTCPIRMECLVHAIENNEFGVWGGLTAPERSRLVKK
jgi:WhiB family redox-sensing transcriptional regulator